MIELLQRLWDQFCDMSDQLEDVIDDQPLDEEPYKTKKFRPHNMVKYGRHGYKAYIKSSTLSNFCYAYRAKENKSCRNYYAST